MKMIFLAGGIAAALALHVPAASAAGCVSGAVVGGVAGHVAGHHGLLGAAAGCAVGHHMAVKRNRANAAARAAQNPGAPQGGASQ